MNRAHTILAEWDDHVAEHGTATPGEARRDEEISELRCKLAEKTRECTTLQHRLDAAATAIAALHHDNTLLREDLARSGGKVIPLHGPRGAVQDDGTASKAQQLISSQLLTRIYEEDGTPTDTELSTTRP